MSPPKTPHAHDTGIIGKIASHESTLPAHLVHLQSNSSDLITLENAKTAADSSLASLNTKTDDNTNRINIQNGEIRAQNDVITNLTSSTADNSNQITALQTLLNDWRVVINKVPGFNLPKL